MTREAQNPRKTADLTFRQARELLTMIEESTAQEVLIEIGDLTLHVVRRDTASCECPDSGRPAVPLTHNQESIAPDTEAIKPATSVVQAGLTSVVAPTAGVFYRAPSPTEPPFAEVGDVVAKGQIIGIVEVMKLLTHVVAPVDGVLVAFTAENAEPVPFESVLASISSSEQ